MECLLLLLQPKAVESGSDTLAASLEMLHFGAHLCATAGVVRWAVLAETAWLPALAVIEPLHGLTFALLHLTCMRLLAESVPRHLAATALTLYGTVGIGAATTLLTLASGPLFGRFGAHGFWVMAALCAAALPLARTVREPTGERT